MKIDGLKVTFIMVATDLDTKRTAEMPQETYGIASSTQGDENEENEGDEVWCVFDRDFKPEPNNQQNFN